MCRSLFMKLEADEIQIMIQFDLHSRELKKNKMERRRDEKKITIKKTGIVEGFTFVDLHAKYNLVAELALEWSHNQLVQKNHSKDLYFFTV